MSEVTHRVDRLTSQCRVSGDVMHIAFSGDLDLHTALAAESVIMESVSDGPTAVVLDLEKLSFIDSAGLNLLIRTKNDIESRGARLYVSRHSHASRRLIELSALTKWFGPIDEFGTDLVPCPICDREITPLVSTCPHCGSAL